MESENTKSLVSIGIPVVKATYLRAAIESCLDQTYKTIEIVILNNAATTKLGDEIEAIVSTFDDIRLKYFRNNKQLPMIENWNKVLSYANGNLFSLLCDDDKWDSDFIFKMVVLSEKYPRANVFHSRVLIIKEGELNEKSKLSPLCNEYEDTLDFICHRIKGYRWQYLSDFTVRLSAIKKIGGFVDLPDGWGSDDITWFKVSATGDGVAYDATPLFIYRDHDGSTTNSQALSNKLNSLKTYVAHVFDILFNIEISNDLDEIKKRAIIEELKIYEKVKTSGLIHKSLLDNSFVPNLFIPYIMVFYKTYTNLKFMTKKKHK